MMDYGTYGTPEKVADAAKSPRWDDACLEGYVMNPAAALEAQAAELRAEAQKAEEGAHMARARALALCQAPTKLSIHGFGSVDGIYDLVPGDFVNNHVTWRKEMPIPMVIYTTPNGRWAVTTPERVAVAKNFIATYTQHNGRFPHEEQWGKLLARDGQRLFEPLPDVHVSIVNEGAPLLFHDSSGLEPSLHGMAPQNLHLMQAY
jgi:hypothetical protein